MTTAVGVLNIVLGLIYCQYGTMTLIEMRRYWDAMGFSHFGAAWIAMAFTCGPHHFVHGLDLLTAHGNAGALDLIVVLVGFPAGVIWFALRVEAATGGAGDRFVSGSPPWIIALPALAAIYATTVLTIISGSASFHLDHIAAVAPNTLLIAIYSLIGYYLIRTRLTNRHLLEGWSVSGLTLAVIFPTCAMMHAVYAYYALLGRYGPAVQTTLIDWLAVPAGLYFLRVVQALLHGGLPDWNRASASPALSQSGNRT